MQVTGYRRLTMKKDDWKGLDAFMDNANSKPKYLRKAIDILSRSKGYTNDDVIALAKAIDDTSHGYGTFGRLPEKDARDNWLDFIKRENADGILSPDDFYYGDEPEEEDYHINNPTGIANPADYIGKVTIEKDTDNDGDVDTKITEYK